MPNYTTEFATEKEQQILSALTAAVKKMNEQEQERLLAFAEGMAFKAAQMDAQ